MAVLSLVIGMIVVTSILAVIGGGIGYFIYIRTRPKKETYIAYVYQKSEGIIIPKDKMGNIIIKDLQLNDLKPYMKDILEKTTPEYGITRFTLQKMKLPTPKVGNNTVDYWGPKERIVHVLYHEGACTLLEKGYDLKTGKALYNPIPYGRLNIIKDEMATRKAAIDNKQEDVLKAILPYVAISLSMIMVFGIAYMTSQAWMQISDKNADATRDLTKLYNRMLTNFEKTGAAQFIQTGTNNNNQNGQPTRITITEPGS